MKNYIPRKKRKTVFINFLKLTFLDLIVGGVFFVGALISLIVFRESNILLAIILFLVFTIIGLILLVPVKKQSNKKAWVVFLNYLKFLILNKKPSKESAKGIFPYKFGFKNVLYIGNMEKPLNYDDFFNIDNQENNSNLKNKEEKVNNEFWKNIKESITGTSNDKNLNSGNFIGALKISGSNIYSKKFEDRQTEYLSLAEIANLKLDIEHSIDSFRNLPISIVYRRKNLNVSKELLEFNLLIQENEKDYENGLISKEQFEKVKKMQNAYLKENFLERDGVFAEERVIGETFIIFYSNSFKNAEQTIEKIQEILPPTLKSEILNYVQITNLIKKMINPWAPDLEKKEIDLSSNLANIFAPEKMKFRDNCLEINENDFKYFIRSGIVNEYNTRPSEVWFDDFKDNDLVIMNFRATDKEYTKKYLSAAKMKVSLEMKGRNFNKEEIDVIQDEDDINIIQEMMDDVALNDLAFGKITTLLVNYHSTKNEVNSANNRQFINYRDKGIQYDNLKHRQEQALKAWLPNKKNYLEKEYYSLISTHVFGISYPFGEAKLDDKNGLVMGTSPQFLPIKFNLNYKDNIFRVNCSACVFGISGIGKSTLVKNLLTHEAMKNNIIIIFDPESEFNDFTNSVGGRSITLGAFNKENIINPLEIIWSKYETKGFKDWKIITSNLIAKHIDELIEWWKLLFPDFEEEELRILKSYFVEFYNEWFKDKDIRKFDSKKYPIITDFYNFLFKKSESYYQQEKLLTEKISIIKNKEEKYLLQKELEQLNKLFNQKENIKIYQKIKITLEVEFIKESTLKKMFNAYSTLNVNKDRIVNFDVKQLTRSKNKKIAKATFLLLFKISRKITEDNADSEKPVAVTKVVDEFHLFIDGKDDYIFKEFYTEIKTVRKVGGGIILITQDLADLAKEQSLIEAAKSFVSNSQYKFLMKLSNDGIRYINDSLGQSNSLTPSEINFIENAKQGQGILMISSKERYAFNAKITKYALNSFKTAREKSQEFSKSEREKNDKINDLKIEFLTSINANFDENIIKKMKDFGVHVLKDLKEFDIYDYESFLDDDEKTIINNVIMEAMQL